MTTQPETKTLPAEQSSGHTPGAAHTPVPWTMRVAKEECYIQAVTDPEPQLYCKVECGWGKNAAAVMEANAAFIVRACNAHKELLTALESILDAATATHPENTMAKHACAPELRKLIKDKARAAIAKARQ